MNLIKQYQAQQFANEYRLVNGVQMHAENGDRFQIPHPVLKKHIRVGDFVELRIDSPRFSVHEDATDSCTCSTCNGAMTKPILSHEHPATLLPVPQQAVPSRGWGEDFWGRVTERDREYFRAVVDNPLYEARLHGLNMGDEVVFHSDHVLAVHSTHRPELVARMSPSEIRTLVKWLGSQGPP